MADSPEVVLRPATSADVKRLAAVLARAFYDDPPLAWLVPDPAIRLGRLNRMFTTIVGIESLRYGGVEVACSGAEIVGAAVWLPPGHAQPSVGEKIQAAPHYVWALAPAWNRAAQYGRALERAHPKAPHWYLKAVGVDPDWQGRGIARLLLRSRLQRCDADGQPAFLETTKPGGVPMYERYGFQPIADIAMPPGAPALAAMWRPPAG
jgi:GNAT superfamily N-acetyltransferase